MTIAAPPELRSWIAAHADPITTVDPAATLDDLTGLRDIVGTATVVGLGASVRGAHELNVLARRMVRFLVEELRFRSIAVEESWSLGLELDHHLRTGDGDLDALLAEGWPPWQTAETKDLLSWARRWNQGNPSDQVRFVGVDSTRPGDAVYDAITQFARTDAPDRLEEIGADIAELRTAATEPEDLVVRARRVLTIVEGVSGGDDREFAVQCARTVVGAFEFGASGRLGDADRHLAENAIWWHRATGDKVVYWGGLGHTANARTRIFSPPAAPSPEPNAGSHLRDHFGSGYVSVGLTFDHGNALYEFPSPPNRFADAVLGTVGPQAFLLDLRTDLKRAAQVWLDTPATMRLVGPSFNPVNNADYHLTGGTLRDWFDALAHIRAVTPVHPLDGQATEPR